MKKYLLATSVIIFMAFFSCQSIVEPTEVQNELIGTYQYTGNLDGMAIITEKHFVFIYKMKTESEIVDSVSMDENIQNPYLFEGGKYSLQDSIATCTFQYSSNPAMVGSSFRYYYTVNGNEYTFNVLGDNDEVVNQGSGTKLY